MIKSGCSSVDRITHPRWYVWRWTQKFKKEGLLPFMLSVWAYHDINKVAFDLWNRNNCQSVNCKTSKRVLRTVIPLLSGQNPRSLYPYVLQTWPVSSSHPYHQSQSPFSKVPKSFFFFFFFFQFYTDPFNGHFDKLYYTSAIDTLYMCMEFSFLLLASFWHKKGGDTNQHNLH